MDTLASIVHTQTTAHEQNHVTECTKTDGEIVFSNNIYEFMKELENKLQKFRGTVSYLKRNDDHKQIIFYCVRNVLQFT